MADMKFVMEQGIEMYDSLLDAVDEAGGSPGCYTINHLNNMTVMELISKLATNGIRFVFEKKTVSGELKEK